jgi:hypothetical protein
VGRIGGQHRRLGSKPRLSSGCGGGSLRRTDAGVSDHAASSRTCGGTIAPGCGIPPFRSGVAIARQAEKRRPWARAAQLPKRRWGRLRAQRDVAGRRLFPALAIRRVRTVRLMPDSRTVGSRHTSNSAASVVVVSTISGIENQTVTPPHPSTVAVASATRHCPPSDTWIGGSPTRQTERCLPRLARRQHLCKNLR